MKYEVLMGFHWNIQWRKRLIFCCGGCSLSRCYSPFPTNRYNAPRGLLKGCTRSRKYGWQLGNPRSIFSTPNPADKSSSGASSSNVFSQWLAKALTGSTLSRKKPSYGKGVYVGVGLTPVPAIWQAESARVSLWIWGNSSWSRGRMIRHL